VLAVPAALAAGLLVGLIAYRVRISALARTAVGTQAGRRTAGGRLRSPSEALEGLVRRSRQAEASLAETEAELRRLRAGLDELALGLVLCDPAGSEILRNRRAVELAAARHGEALVAKAVDELLADARNGVSSSRRVELTQPRHAYEVWAMPLRSPAVGYGEADDSTAAGGPAADSEILGALALVRDITDELRVDRVRKDFVANVSHELKTPIGALALLAEALTTTADPSALSLIERIHNQVDRATRTIDDLMMLSLIEDGADLSAESADVASLVAGAIERISEAAAQSGVEVIAADLDAGAEPAGVVRGSTVQLESAVFNLLDNAVKYSEPGGTVRVSVACSGDQVEVSVQDHGIGIPEAEQDRVFERFYRVDGTRSRDTGGTGLGLSMVRHVVINHDGELELSSREGAGSVFTIRLPRAAAVGSAGSAGPAGADGDSSARAGSAADASASAGEAGAGPS